MLQSGMLISLPTSSVLHFCTLTKLAAKFQPRTTSKYAVSGVARPSTDAYDNNDQLSHKLNFDVFMYNQDIIIKKSLIPSTAGGFGHPM